MAHYRFDDYLKSLLAHLRPSREYELVIEATNDERRFRWEEFLTDGGVRQVGKYWPSSGPRVDVGPRRDTMRHGETPRRARSLPWCCR